jgi:hypothetical protein
MISPPRESLRFGHYRLRTLDEDGVTQDAARFDEMLHLEDLSVDGRIRSRQPIEGAPEVEHAVQIQRALPFGFTKSEIRDCGRRPRHLVDLQAAINRYLAEHNRSPKPFIWIADPDRIIAAANRRYQMLD